MTGEERRSADPTPISFGRRLSLVAAEHPERTAVHFYPAEGEPRRLSWAELDLASNRMARLLAARGVDDTATVVVGLPSTPEHLVAALGAWKLGACVLPLSAKLPTVERDQILALVQARAVVADWEDLAAPPVRTADLRRLGELAADPLPDRVPHPGKAIGSGGSTGRPKIIVDPSPWARVPGVIAREWGPWTGFAGGQTQLVMGPLYHNAGFTWSHFGLFEEHTLILMQRFDAARALDLIERHRVNWMFLVPTMMRRIVAQPDVRRRDFSSIEAIFHGGGACQPWLKEAWIELIGAECVYETYGATEAIGRTAIRGDEWLRHRGSVGRPAETELRVLDEKGNEVPPDVVGEVYMRWRHRRGATYRYIGSPNAAATGDGFQSVGDLGWVDREGYLFLADRRADMIVTGGANIYPAEVEAVLDQHPAVRDVAVIGVPDEEWGRRVHAIVEPADLGAPPSVHDLDAWCRARLVAYKVPKSFEFVEALPRTEVGKLRRTALAAEREGRLASAQLGGAPDVTGTRRPA